MTRSITDIASSLVGRPQLLRWRAPLPDVTDLAPGWRRHDATHLEITLDYPVGGPTAWVWESWVFLPDSFRLGPGTYPDDQIGSDIQSYFRFSPPSLELCDAPPAVDDLINLFGREPQDAILELKLFGCRLRESIDRRGFATRLLVREAEPSSDAAVMTFVSAIDEAMSTVRDRLLPAALQHGVELGETAARVDEHLSQCFEAAMIKLDRDLVRAESRGPVVERVRGAAVGEARYRAGIAAAQVASADSSTDELEQVERRQHALKRMTSSVLWLQPEAQDSRRRAGHILHAIAAGIAMSFAVLAALLYGAPSDATDLWVWGGLVVLAYMVKDRMKSGLQEIFDRRISRRYPNRSWVIRDRLGTKTLANADAKYGFVSTEELPAEVSLLRNELYRDSFGDVIETHAILFNTKVLCIETEAVLAVDTRVAQMTEILRLDISRWLTHTDDPSRTVTLADPDSGRLFESALPRAYDVMVLHRLASRGQEGQLVASRVVVSRNGIRRVDQLLA